MALEFREPFWLLSLVLAIPVYLGLRRSVGRLRFSSMRALPPHASTWRSRLSSLPDIAMAAGTAALALALAGPRVGDRASKVQKQGIAIMMVVDTSGSMRALDLSDGKHERTRLDAIKDVFRDFMLGGQGLGGRANDVIGVVTFARYADTRAPLTLDHASLESVLKTIEIVSDENEDGTAMGDGLALALERLRESKAQSKIAILLTDGVQNAGQTDPVPAAELARTLGVKVYSIGAGTNGFAPVRVVDPLTGRPTLASVPVEIDESTLKAVSEKTQGRYFRATDGETLRRIYQEIDRLERTQFEEERYLQYREFYPAATVIGLVLLVLGALAGATLLRRLP
jgi:Ca-activated chloride channel family protein